MCRTDLLAAAIGASLILLFALETPRNLYETAYLNAPLLITFVKFGLLATGGEVLAQRIREGRYHLAGFGVIPKIVVWGILGLAIYAAFGIFSAGVPVLFASFLERISAPAIPQALLISIFLNVFFAPIMMVTHHLSDRHIASQGGRFTLKNIDLALLLKEADWARMWGTIFKKTIPFFWIPAHTVTFLLPPQFRTAYAAALSIILGLFLGAVAQKGHTQTREPLSLRDPRASNGGGT